MLAMDTYWVGGWNLDTIYHVIPSTSTVVGTAVALNIAGMAMDHTNNHLWIINNAAPDTLYEYNVTSGTPVLLQGPITVPWMTDNLAYSAAGLSYDDATGCLIAMNQSSQALETFMDLNPAGTLGIAQGSYCYTAATVLGWGLSSNSAANTTRILDLQGAGGVQVPPYTVSEWVNPPCIAQETPTPTPIVAGDACAMPFSISMNSQVLGDTSTFADNGWQAGARDVVYQLVTTDYCTAVSISLSGSVINDTYLRLLGSDCATVIASDDDTENTAITCAEGQSTMNSSLSGLSLAAGTYHIVVEGYSASYQGPYCLDVWGTCGGDTPTPTPSPTPCFTCPAGAVIEPEVCGDDTKGGCNSTPAVFTTINCGDTICGTGWFDGSTRDTDWYQLVLPIGQHVTLSINSSFAGLFGFLENTVPGSGNAQI